MQYMIYSFFFKRCYLTLAPLSSIIFGNLRIIYYHKVASNRQVYYSILELFGQSIEFPLHKPSENLKMCYQPIQTTARDFTVILILFSYYFSPISVYKLHSKTDSWLWKPRRTNVRTPSIFGNSVCSPRAEQLQLCFSNDSRSQLCRSS